MGYIYVITDGDATSTKYKLEDVYYTTQDYTAEIQVAISHTNSCWREMEGYSFSCGVGLNLCEFMGEKKGRSCLSAVSHIATGYL